MKSLKHLVILCVLLLAAFAAVGVKQGWFSFNKDKFQSDEDKAKQKVTEVVNNHK